MSMVGDTCKLKKKHYMEEEYTYVNDYYPIVECYGSQSDKSAFNQENKVKEKRLKCQDEYFEHYY